ncbi:MAG: hypothetical protein CL830_02710 [Crocinitomicaceae bacterium]|jgi:hypothetical protein|nr:hypothetical protein [Crocinitomicaceae bacterium]CAI8156395.1 MAG: Uncharacterised protein [Crocinitomicaceae bacterium]|tara:strand:- start:5745 stop:6380 length:636 start_codon:yes stop_codon:yes gene_type:complete
MKFYILLIFSLLNLSISSQNLGLENKDSVLFGQYLPDLEITASSADFVKKWNRTKFYVKSVYDYAKICSAMLTTFEDSLSKIEGKYSRKRYLSSCNKTLKKEFGNEIKEMSIKRGVYLMKMIYRSTGLTTYEIIQKYRGGGTAFWFQALCLVNGQDLKREYDSENEDLLMERAIGLIDSGKMTYYKRVPLTDEARKALKQKRKEKKRKKKK